MLEKRSPVRDFEAVVFIKQASYNTTYSLTLDGKTYSFTTADGVAPADEPADSLSSEEIAANLAGQISGKTSPTPPVPPAQGEGDLPAPGPLFCGEATQGEACLLSGGDAFADNLQRIDITGGDASLANSPATQEPESAYEVLCKASSLWIRRKDRADFQLEVHDSRSNTHSSLAKGKVQTFTDLLTVAPDGFTCEIVGNAASRFDTYYVRFETSNPGETFGKGVWKECAAPGIPCELAPGTLPHALIRQADGSFLFDALTWGPRSAGDVHTAPDPSFVGRPLSGIFFYRNRLAFLAAENVIMSRVGEYFSFFPSTVTALVDDDPIDVAASHTRPADLKAAISFSGGLLIFGEDTQYSLEHDTVLANATVSLKPVTEFAASLQAQPVSAGKTVFFAVNKGAFGGIREYLTLPDSTDQNDAADITAHVPRYIAGDIHHLACSTNEDTLFVLSRREPWRIWVYKYFWNGAEKIQSSWGVWEFGADVLSCFLVDTTLYLVCNYPDGVFLECLHIEPGYKDPGASFEFCLDRKITEQALTIHYDAVRKHSTLTLPWATSDTPVVVARQGSSKAAEGTLFPLLERRAANQVTVRGDLRNIPLYVGVPYLSSYTFSTFGLREQNATTAVLAGRLQIRSLSLACTGTGGLDISVTPQYREASLHHFTAKELGRGDMRIGQLPLYSGTITVLSLIHI